MKNQPILFKCLSLLFLSFGLCYPFWSFNGEHLIISIFPNAISLMDTFLIASFVSLAFGFYKSWVITHYLFMANIFLVVMNFVYSISNKNFYNSITPIVVGIFYYSLYLVFTQSDEFIILVNKKKQWWKSAKRVPVKIPTTLYLDNDDVELETVDISESGVLLKMNNPNAYKKYQDLIGSEVSIAFSFDEDNMQFSNAKIVRLNLGEVGNKGLALNFTEKSGEFNKYIKNLLN